MEGTFRENAEISYGFSRIGPSRLYMRIHNYKEALETYMNNIMFLFIYLLIFNKEKYTKKQYCFTSSLLNVCLEVAN